MPCWTVRTTTLSTQKFDHKLLEQALQALGYRVNRSGPRVSWNGGHYENGEILFREGAEIAARTLNLIKQAYSTQIVMQTSRKYGWQLKQTAANKFQVVRR